MRSHQPGWRTRRLTHTSDTRHHFTAGAGLWPAVRNINAPIQARRLRAALYSCTRNRSRPRSQTNVRYAYAHRHVQPGGRTYTEETLPILQPAGAVRAAVARFALHALACNAAMQVRFLQFGHTIGFRSDKLNAL